MSLIKKRPQLFSAALLLVVGVVASFSLLGLADERVTGGVTEIPVRLTGAWQATEVLVDAAASRRLPYQRNDPRLTGRIFWISSTALSNNTPEAEKCEVPRVVIRRLSVEELIRDSMGGRSPTPADFDFPVPGSLLVDVLSVKCEKGDWLGGSLGHKIEGAWILLLPDGRLAIRWYGETVVLLQRLPEDARPDPSFDCVKATTAAERTICASVALAAFDRSVAQAYEQTKKFFEETENPEAISRLRATQRRWLAQRNRCGADPGCLEKSMEGRLEAIQVILE